MIPLRRRPGMPERHRSDLECGLRRGSLILNRRSADRPRDKRREQNEWSQQSRRQFRSSHKYFRHLNGCGRSLGVTDNGVNVCVDNPLEWRYRWRVQLVERRTEEDREHSFLHPNGG